MQGISLQKTSRANQTAWWMVSPRNGARGQFSTCSTRSVSTIRACLASAQKHEGLYPEILPTSPSPYGKVDARPGHSSWLNVQHGARGQFSTCSTRSVSTIQACLASAQGSCPTSAHSDVKSPALTSLSPAAETEQSRISRSRKTRGFTLKSHQPVPHLVERWTLDLVTAVDGTSSARTPSPNTHMDLWICRSCSSSHLWHRAVSCLPHLLGLSETAPLHGSPPPRPLRASFLSW